MNLTWVIGLILIYKKIQKNNLNYFNHKRILKFNMITLRVLRILTKEIKLNQDFGNLMLNLT